MNTRERELDKLQIVLSLKRLREYQKEAEALEQEQNQEVGKKKKTNAKNKTVKRMIEIQTVI
jgi:hypothetical protein